MRRTLVTLALAGTLGLTGAALLAPGSALAQTADGTPRITALKDALKGLVTDGTITQEQADEVATTLAEQLPHRGGGHGRGHVGRAAQEEVAKVLGITVEQLRTERRAGRTLAQIAEAEGLSREDLVDGLVAAARTRIAAEVEAGRLTQERADALAQGLEARVEAKVDSVGRGPGGHGGRGHGRGGHGGSGHGGSGHGGSDEAPAPKSTVPSPQVETSSA